jgi:chromosome segregation ATPase
MTLENCEKLIKEAETNYINLKSQYDQIIVKMKRADDEMNDLKQKNINQDTSITFYKKELNKVNDFNYANEMEVKCNSLIEENIKLKQKEEEESSRLKEENELLKKNIDMIDNKYKEKCKQLNDNKKMINEAKKKHEKELQKYKIEIKNYKNIISKGKNSSTINNINDDKIKEYEKKINKLIQENNDYKNNLEIIEKTQIVEYQKLLDDSFSKIAQLNREIIDFKDKNTYLEKALNILENNPIKNEKRINDIIELNEENNNQNKNIESTLRNKNNDINYSLEKNWKNNLDEENKDFLGKKRKEMSNNNNTGILNKENRNIVNTEFSNFEI